MKEAEDFAESPSPHDPGTVAPPAHNFEEARELARQGKYTRAFRLVRERTGWSMKQIQDFARSPAGAWMVPPKRREPVSGTEPLNATKSAAKTLLLVIGALLMALLIAIVLFPNARQSASAVRLTAPTGPTTAAARASPSDTDAGPIAANQIKAVRLPPPPQFKVVGEDTGVRVVTVAPSISEEQLIALVNSFRAARRAGTLGQMFTPTTPGGSKGPFLSIEILVMSDSKWATSQRVHKFFDSAPSATFDREYGKRVRADYFYTGGSSPEFEYGTIGFSVELATTGFDHGDASKFRSANFRRLF